MKNLIVLLCAVAFAVPAQSQVTFSTEVIEPQPKKLLGGLAFPPRRGSQRPSFRFHDGQVRERNALCC